MASTVKNKDKKRKWGKKWEPRMKREGYYSHPSLKGTRDEVKGAGWKGRKRGPRGRIMVMDGRRDEIGGE